jgi:hypothetical protein
MCRDQRRNGRVLTSRRRLLLCSRRLRCRRRAAWKHGDRRRRRGGRRVRRTMILVHAHRRRRRRRSRKAASRLRSFLTQVVLPRESLPQHQSHQHHTHGCDRRHGTRVRQDGQAGAPEARGIQRRRMPRKQGCREQEPEAGDEADHLHHDQRDANVRERLSTVGQAAAARAAFVHADVRVDGGGGGGGLTGRHLSVDVETVWQADLSTCILFFTLLQRRTQPFFRRPTSSAQTDACACSPQT